MASLKGFSSVHIVLDALDECQTGNGERRRLLEIVRRIAMLNDSTLHIFCTSRREQDIELALAPICSTHPRYLISINDGRNGLTGDIKLYIESTFASPDYDSWPESIKKEALSVLLQKADDM